MTYDPDLDEIEELEVKLKEAGFVRCKYCDTGWRHPIGDCVHCQKGPAPGGNIHPFNGITTDPKEKIYKLKLLLSYHYRPKEIEEVTKIYNQWAMSTEPVSALITALVNKFGN